MFSAKKKDWKKLYELAREWINLNLKSEMKINNYKIIEYKFPILKLELNVWSGTYIRSIWYHIWKQLGLWWTLKVLHRKNIWNFEL
jgi:tRNA pseudouridine55 synthase